ncbi:unnamed protein product [Closterium sp. Naga37s-1]|nr:unnamed protein product [Closterium sp. Naga37s-1]
MFGLLRCRQLIISFNVFTNLPTHSSVLLSLVSPISPPLALPVPLSACPPSPLHQPPSLSFSPSLPTSLLSPIPLLLTSTPLIGIGEWLQSPLSPVSSPMRFFLYYPLIPLVFLSTHFVFHFYFPLCPSSPPHQPLQPFAAIRSAKYSIGTASNVHVLVLPLVAPCHVEAYERLCWQRTWPSRSLSASILSSQPTLPSLPWLPHAPPLSAPSAPSSALPSMSLTGGGGGGCGGGGMGGVGAGAKAGSLGSSTITSSTSSAAATAAAAAAAATEGKWGVEEGEGQGEREGQQQEGAA